MKRVSSVFYITVTLVTIFVFLGASLPKQFEQITTNINSFLSTTFGWYYMWLMSALIILSIFITVSPYGKIRLGKNNEKPDFSTPSWIAMLFSAGLGIGLVFYGAAEPLFHGFLDAPFAEVGTDQAFKQGLAVTYLHWGIHGWALYGFIALALAFFQFRKGEPGLISTTLKPLFGETIMKGPLGKMIDVLASFATIFGVATSLGFGALQVNGGLNHLFGIEVNFTAQFIIVAIITVLFLISSWLGLSKGIRYLSNVNMVVAILLLLGMIIIGPTLLIMNMFTETFGLYFQNIIQWSFRTAPLDSDNRTWVDAWTIFTGHGGFPGHHLLECSSPVYHAEEQSGNL